MKVYGVTNLTFEEWDALRSERMLPGQKQSEDTTTVVPIVTPISTGR